MKSTSDVIIQPKPTLTLTLTRIITLNAVVCGLEFCISAAFCYVPPLLLKAGIPEQNMTLVLSVGPILGFFFVPVIGRSSDKCKSIYGRRRPYILALSITLVVSLIILAYGDLLSLLVFGGGDMGITVKIGLLIIGSFLLDFSCQACLTPCEALLSDVSKDTGQHDRCFTFYSLAISVGGCVGYLITALDWQDSFFGDYMGNQERTVFVMLIFLYCASLMATFCSVTEVPLTITESSVHEVIIDKSVKALSHGDTGTVCDPGYVSDDMHSSDESIGISSRRETPRRILPIRENPAVVAVLESYIDITRDLGEAVWRKIYTMMPDNFKALFGVPMVLRRLAVANFWSWTSLMAFNLFFTDYVGQSVYGGDPHAAEDSAARELYDEGVRAGSWGLLFHCVSSSFYAPAVELISSRLGMRNTYMSGMVTFSLSMMLVLTTSNIYIVNLLAACTGIAYATMTTIPFMLVTSYHSKRELYFYDTKVGTKVPVRGFGTDLSTLDSAYFLSQVVLTVFMGSIVHYTHSVASYIVVSSVAGILSCYFIRQVVGDQSQMQMLIKSNLM